MTEIKPQVQVQTNKKITTKAIGLSQMFASSCSKVIFFIYNFQSQLYNLISYSIVERVDMVPGEI